MVTTMTEPPLRAFAGAARLTAGPALQRSGHGLAHSLARLLRDTQHGRHRIGHRCRIGDRGQLENPNTIRKFVDQTPGYLGCKPRLADAANRVCPVSINLTLTDSRNAGYPATPRSARVSIVPAFKYFGGTALTEAGDWRCQAEIWAANPSRARSTRKLSTALRPDTSLSALH
jgi:hypothetical protein